MRTIKFRAKNLDGEWIYGFYVEEERQTLNGFEKKYFIVNDGYDYVKPDTVGQFTGLADMNGREIFENDVIGVNGIPAGIVSWHYNGYYFIDDNLGEDLVSNSYRPLGEMIEYSKINKINFEVIGNIHDNPELLK